MPKDGIFYEISNNLKKIVNKDIYSALQNQTIKLTANDIEHFKPDAYLKTKEFTEAEIIHLHNLHGNYFPLKSLIKASNKKPVVWTLHDMWAITGHVAHAFCDKWQEGCKNCQHLDIYQELPWNNSYNLWRKKKEIYKKSKLNIVVPSLWLKNKVTQSILADQPIHYIPNGVDTNIFQPSKNKSSVRKELKLPVNKKIIQFSAYRGLSNTWKGGDLVQNLIKKYRNNSDLLFVVIGKSTDSFSSPNLITVDSVENESKMAQYYQGSDLLLFPSIAENLPLSIIEAMSCGLVVLAHDTGGISEIVTDKTGIAYKGKNNLEHKFEEFLHLSSKQLNKMQINSRERVLDKFSIEQMFKNYLQLYKQLT
jgi:glycosyltransferase involved in cell wall biosynthesis